MMTVEQNSGETIWAQKYRPKRVADTILPTQLKQVFQKYVDDGDIPNLLLSGSHGMGKTTSAVAMLEEIGCDYIKINGSLNGGIDTLRHEIANFASTVSFSGGRKVVLIDEGDHLTGSTQAAMRSFMEEFSKNCSFIITCNHKLRIIEPLRESRFTQVDFVISAEERPVLAAQFFKRVLEILQMEGVEFDKKVVASIVNARFPDFRRTLNDLQKASKFGRIDESALSNQSDVNLDTLFGLLKDKKFTDMRKWVAQNSDMDYGDFFRELYTLSPEKVELKSMPCFVVTLAKYQYQHNFVADPEVNAVAMLAEIMLEASFK